MVNALTTGKLRGADGGVLVGCFSLERETVKGFKEFILRGNLVELAVAFVMGAAFAAVVTKFTNFFMDVIGSWFGAPNFDKITILHGARLGEFITALVTFLIIACVVYFLVVMPYEAARKRFRKEGEVEAQSETKLLTEIRDLLAQK